MDGFLVPAVKGILVAVFVSAIGLKAYSPKWWLAIFALNILVII
jgi:hypothetical protein